MKWYKSLYAIVPLSILAAFLNYNPQLLFGSTTYFHWGWQCSVVSTLLIIFMVRLRRNEEWKTSLGVKFERKDILGFITATSLLAPLCYWLISFVLESSNHNFLFLLLNYSQVENLKGIPFHGVIAMYLFYIPQTLNEEMVVGALLLFYLKRRLKIKSNLALTSIVAIVFSLMHQALYKYSPVQPGELLTLSTLTSLFLVGVLRNFLILRTGKIAYAWAIHLSWNLMFFPNPIVLPTGEFASEPRRFNLILGDWRVLTIILIATVIVVVWPNLIKRFRPEKVVV